MKNPGYLFLVGLSLLAAACGGSSSSTAPNPFAGFTSAQYENVANWVCHPSLPEAEDICRQNLDATVVFPDGTTEVEVHERPTDPEFDCFYVYPTLSIDPAPNSDLIANDEERFVTLNQAARYSRVCRVFTPIHRQVTLLAGNGDIGQGDRELAYGDVLDSFKWYMAHENQGRGFVLLSHSQGTSYARRLVDEWIEEDESLADRLISAHLIGGTVRVVAGSDVGDSAEIASSFDMTPACRSRDQSGCVVSFATYRQRAQFVPEAPPAVGETQRVCVNPADPTGGLVTLDAYFPRDLNPTFAAVLVRPAPDFPWKEPRPKVETPFIKVPGLISGQCVFDPDVGHVLEISSNPAPGPRADTFNGEIIVYPERNLHLVDMTLTMGDLVTLAESQAASWREGR